MKQNLGSARSAALSKCLAKCGPGSRASSRGSSPAHSGVVFGDARQLIAALLSWTQNTEMATAILQQSWVPVWMARLRKLQYDEAKCIALAECIYAIGRDSPFVVLLGSLKPRRSASSSASVPASLFYDNPLWESCGHAYSSTSGTNLQRVVICHYWLSIVIITYVSTIVGSGCW